jgi:hypothetical protein
MSFRVRANVLVGSSAGSCHGLTSLGPHVVLQAVARPVDGDHVAVVEEPVEDGGSQDVVSEDLPPLAEGLVPGDDDGTPLVAATDELEWSCRSSVASSPRFARRRVSPRWPVPDVTRLPDRVTDDGVATTIVGEGVQAARVIGWSLGACGRSGRVLTKIFLCIEG